MEKNWWRKFRCTSSVFVLCLTTLFIYLSIFLSFNFSFLLSLLLASLCRYMGLSRFSLTGLLHRVHTSTLQPFDVNGNSWLREIQWKVSVCVYTLPDGLNKLVENTQIHFSLKSLIYGTVSDHPGAACKQGWLFEELLTSLPWNQNTQFCDSRLNENCCAVTGLTDVCYLAELSAKRIYCVFMPYFCKSDQMESFHASVSQSVCLLFVCVCDLTNECIF